MSRINRELEVSFGEGMRVRFPCATSFTSHTGWSGARDVPVRKTDVPMCQMKGFILANNVWVGASQFGSFQKLERFVTSFSDLP